jgi:hypothetical protein
VKFFAFILAILVLALSMTPCADTGLIAKESKTKTEISKATDHQSHNGTDNCSPFCQCSCCAGFSLPHSIALVSVAMLLPEPVRTAHLPTNVIEISLPIWQPPQLV